MKDQVLSIKQMQHLKELGIDVSKASMAWYQDYDDLLDRSYSLYELTNFTKKLYNIPTFTLQDMIELMPSKVKYEGKSYYLSIDKKFVGYIDDMVVEDCVLESDSSILENTYKVLVWLAENKYI